MRAYFRPSRHLFPAMAIVLVGAGLFSRARIRQGDLPGVEYFVFPFLHHGHGEIPASFLPGSWSVNFLFPSYLISVIANAVRGRGEPLAIGSAVFYYIWLTLSAIVEVASDTIVPVLVLRHQYPFQLLVVLVEIALAGSVVVAHLCSRGATGEW